VIEMNIATTSRTLLIVAVFLGGTLVSLGASDAQSTDQGATATQMAASNFNGDLRQFQTAPDERGHSSDMLRPMPQGQAQAPPFQDGSAPGKPTPPTGTGAPQAPLAPMPGASINVEGMGNANYGGNVVPPDPHGTVGLNHYIQFLNSGNGGTVGIYNKADGSLNTQFYYTNLWPAGNACHTTSRSDTQAVYDSVNGRYILQDITVSSPYQFCFAVSQSSDPVTGGWWLYTLPSNQGNSGLPDYEKLGVWPDGLYWGSQGGGVSGGAEAWVANLAQMEAGQTASVQVKYMGSVKQQGVETIYRPSPSTYSAATGTPPTGAPNYFGTIYSAKIFREFKFHVDWTNPALSTLTRVDVPLGTWSIEGTTVVSTANSIDTLREHLTGASKYTNIGGVESLWNTHGTANPSATSIGTNQWFQITNPAGTPVVTQQAIYAPDNTVSRIQGGVGVDKQGNMLLEYSATSSSVNPGVRYAGRLATDPLNTLGQSETVLVNGGGGFSANCPTTCHRWGDYTSVTLDPVDGCTLWFNHEYMQATGLNWNTRIGAVKFTGCV
jgi:hypothetical protein